MITLKQLEAVKWVAMLGSFEKAAERLYVSQSAISKRIQDLEAALECTLFDRQGRNALLTDKGHAIVLLGQQVLELRNEIISVGASQRTVIRQLQFGVTELAALTWLPAFVSELRTLNPKIVLKPEVEMSETLAEGLASGALDFIVVPDSVWRPSFKTVPLANVQNVWVASPELFFDPAMVSVQELTKHSILTQGTKSGSGIFFRKWAEKQGVEFPRQISSNSLLALVGLTVAALGVSYLPHQAFRSIIEQGLLRVLETEPSLPPVTYVLMFRSDESSTMTDTVVEIARRTCNFSQSIQWLTPLKTREPAVR